MFKTKIKMLPNRPGERYASALTNMNLFLIKYIKDSVNLI